MKELVIDLKGEHKVNEVKEIGPVEYGIKKDFTFGNGYLASSIIPGTHRLIFTNYSKLWDGLFISTIGGLGSELFAAGLNYVRLTNKAEKPTVLSIRNFGDGVQVVKHEINDLDSIYEGYKGKRGIFALEQYVYDVFAKDYIDHNAVFQIMSVGPASTKTEMGAIGSTLIENGKFVEGIDEWAARGCFGSVMYQNHNVVSIIFGGVYGKINQGIYDKNDKSTDLASVNEVFNKVFGKGMIETVREVTVKYFYNPELKTGGTFGCNYKHLKDTSLSFNWSSTYLTKEERERIYKEFIENHFLKQFNEEIIEKRSFRTCGEPCPTACKKYWQEGKLKRDYEPYEANGPNIGIFDIHEADRVVREVNTLGYDAIEVGTMLSWLMESLAKEYINPKELGVEKPNFDLKHFNIIEDSKRNADIAIKLLHTILDHPVLSKGIRYAANHFGDKAKNLALYTPHKKGAIAPAQYWVPAFFLPIAVQGKFLSYYKSDFKDPYELGKLCAQRAVKELYSDNFGICRFHRGWVEKGLQTILKELYNLDLDVESYCKEIVKKIYLDHNCSNPNAWETERVYDVIFNYLKDARDKMEKDTEKVDEWIAKFEKDKISAGREYWKLVVKGAHDFLGIPVPDWAR